jgi:hypothetical protein
MRGVERAAIITQFGDEAGRERCGRRGALRFEKAIRQGRHKNRVFVSIRKSEVNEIGRVRGVFNRGVSISRRGGRGKPVARDEWLVVASVSLQKRGEIAKNLRLGIFTGLSFIRLKPNPNRRFAIRNSVIRGAALWR